MPADANALLFQLLPLGHTETWTIVPFVQFVWIALNVFSLSGIFFLLVHVAGVHMWQHDRSVPAQWFA